MTENGIFLDVDQQEHEWFVGSNLFVGKLIPHKLAVYISRKCRDFCAPILYICINLSLFLKLF